LITGILIDSRGGQRYFRNFYLRRALRIFPLYFAILLLSVFVLPRVLPPDKAARFGAVDSDIVFYFFYLQNVPIAAAGGMRHAVLDITWSLAIEEQFYLVWPFIVQLFRPAALKRVCLGLMGFALLFRITYVLAYDPPAFAVYVLTPCRVDALAVGAYLAVCQRDSGGLAGLGRYAPRVGLAAIGLALAVIALELRYGLTPLTAPGFGLYSLMFGFSIVAVGFGALLVHLLLSPERGWLQRAFSSRPAVFLGKYSYGIYLVHLPIRAVIRDRFYGPSYANPPSRFLTWAGSELPGQLLFYPLVLVPILTVAWLSYHVFEKRFLALKRHLE
jgi:peptidoglycan/LPS O-acetylase OafA/YrhL